MDNDEVFVTRLGGLEFLLLDDDLSFFVKIRDGEMFEYELRNIERCFLRKHSDYVIKLLHDGALVLNPPCLYKFAIPISLTLFSLDFLVFSEPEPALLNECVRNFVLEQSFLRRKCDDE